MCAPALAAERAGPWVGPTPGAAVLGEMAPAQPARGPPSPGTAESAAHRLKGAALALGATALAEAARALEGVARAGRAAPASVR